MSGHQAPHTPHTDDGKGGQAGPDRLQAAELEAGQQKDRQPGPHGIKLPHVPQVAQVRQCDFPIAQDFANEPPVKARCCCSVWPLVHKERRQKATQGSQPGRQIEHRPPVIHPTQGVEQMRGR